MNWFNRAEAELEDDFATGDITYQEYSAGMRDLYAELEQSRQDAAQSAYDNY